MRQGRAVRGGVRQGRAVRGGARRLLVGCMVAGCRTGLEQVVVSACVEDQRALGDKAVEQVGVRQLAVQPLLDLRTMLTFHCEKILAQLRGAGGQQRARSLGVADGRVLHGGAGAEIRQSVGGGGEAVPRALGALAEHGKELEPLRRDERVAVGAAVGTGAFPTAPTAPTAAAVRAPLLARFAQLVDLVVDILHGDALLIALGLDDCSRHALLQHARQLAQLARGTLGAWYTSSHQGRHRVLILSCVREADRHRDRRRRRACVQYPRVARSWNPPSTNPLIIAFPPRSESGAVPNGGTSIDGSIAPDSQVATGAAESRTGRRPRTRSPKNFARSTRSISDIDICHSSNSQTKLRPLSLALPAPQLFHHVGHYPQAQRESSPSRRPPRARTSAHDSATAQQRTTRRACHPRGA